MSFIAAILILNLDEADAFIMLANILNWPLLAAFFTVDQEQVHIALSLSCKFSHKCTKRWSPATPVSRSSWPPLFLSLPHTSPVLGSVLICILLTGSWLSTPGLCWNERASFPFYICFHARPCPLDVTCRIWDLIIRDGESFLLKTALGILSLYEETLLKETDFVHIAQFLSKLPDDFNCDKLFDKIEVGFEILDSIYL